MGVAWSLEEDEGVDHLVQQRLLHVLHRAVLEERLREADGAQGAVEAAHPGAPAAQRKDHKTARRTGTHRERGPGSS